MMPFQAMRLRRPSAALSTDRIHMDYEGSNGSTTFLDIGTGLSTWTASGGAGAVTLSTVQVLAGTSSLRVLGPDYLSSPYASSNRIPATANWDINFRVHASEWTGSGLGRYVLSVQDSTATAAGTAFAIATNASQQLQVVLSDGTTRSVIVAGSAATTVSATTNTLISVQRRGSTITLYINGVSKGTGTFSGSVNFPAGRSWRIGQPEAGTASAPATMYFDSFQLIGY